MRVKHGLKYLIVSILAKPKGSRLRVKHGLKFPDSDGSVQADSKSLARKAWIEIILIALASFTGMKSLARKAWIEIYLDVICETFNSEVACA